MKIKSILSLILILILTLLSAGCGQKNDSGDAPFFKLENDPTLSFYKQSKEIVGRYNSDYTDKFKASNSYGEIMPFMGKYLTYSTTNNGEIKSVTNPLYGICTEDGRVIVDPVYKSVEQVKLADGTQFYIFRVDSKSTTRADSYIIIGHDGSWMTEIQGNITYSGLGSDNRIAFLKTRKYNNGDLKYYYDFYNYEGDHIFTYQPLQNTKQNASSTISAFGNGAAAVNEVYKNDDGTETRKAYYVNRSGYTKFKNLTYAGDFSNGYAVVADNEGKYGVINETGKYIIKPAYKNINYNTELGLFTCHSDENCSVLDTKGQVVKIIHAIGSDVSVVGSQTLIYEKVSHSTNKKEYFYLENDEPFTYSGTGQFPTAYIGNGIYICDYSNVCYFFNEKGDAIYTFENFGGIVSAEGNYIVVKNKRNDKLVFIDFNNKTVLSNIEYAYCDGLYNKGLFVVEKNGKYSIYDAVANSFKITDCDYAEIIKSFKKDYFSVVKSGFVELYDDSFNLLLRTAGTEV